MNSGNSGAFNRSMYDTCSYQKDLYESVSPLAYQMYFGKHENCGKCLYDNFYVKYQPEIVDVESELRNITRPLSDCDQFKYSPTCKRSGLCISTFDKSAPVVLAPEVCPIIYNNIPKQTNPGYTVPSANICKNPY
ncbi:hypothetical protein QKU48_gp0504 [Fadolivirus algeromassiliense]|jgi:hypothetical protein|uniref:Uncharacterized protein n=1 Tax=Fadolivirus FV1/VV64 TaxID=3070911 RepID=A0A7D3R0S9_9VIRU|nr:hypothetical protein QKU48_gp0504 [Fadolivirus algeromassiliense]QKF93962.1 hypothetical protein Fadolivirus_1_504 [Fadolivirus FV1/VV64]